MKCDNFRSLNFSFPINPSEMDLYTKYINHMNKCANCENFYLNKLIESRGANPNDFCCSQMGEKITFVCEKHPASGSCYDYVIIKGDLNDVGINAYGGGYCKINYCPWCGSKIE